MTGAASPRSRAPPGARVCSGRVNGGMRGTDGPRCERRDIYGSVARMPRMNLPLRTFGLLAATVALTLSAAGCKEDEKDTGGGIGSQCDPEAEASECAEDLTCESAPGTEVGGVCAAPLTLRGMVVDAGDAAGIEDARVFAMNA